MRNSALKITKPVVTEQGILNHKKNSKPIILYNLDRTVYGQYASISDASDSVGCDVRTIRRALNTDKKILKRRSIVKYVNS